MNFSVLMSVYVKEKASYFNECVNSVMDNTVKPNEIVIVKDGPITEELDETINKFIIQYPGLFKIIKFELNQGLGLALRSGVEACSNELIARMDTDDICVRNRFELQLKEFETNPKLDIIGGQILEFEGSIKNILAKRKVPLSYEDIIKYQKKRSAFNHMTVMFKKSSVLNAGNYQDAPLMEDDLLWANMLINNCYGINSDKVLVYARTGLDMIERRGGIQYVKKYIKGRKKIMLTGFISYPEYIYTNLIQMIVALIPKKIRKLVFIKLLR